MSSSRICECGGGGADGDTGVCWQEPGGDGGTGGLLTGRAGDGVQMEGDQHHQSCCFSSAPAAFLRAFRLLVLMFRPLSRQTVRNMGSVSLLLAPYLAPGSGRGAPGGSRQHAPHH